MELFPWAFWNHVWLVFIDMLASCFSGGTATARQRGAAATLRLASPGSGQAARLARRALLDLILQSINKQRDPQRRATLWPDGMRIDVSRWSSLRPRRTLRWTSLFLIQRSFASAQGLCQMKLWFWDWSFDEFFWVCFCNPLERERATSSGFEKKKCHRLGSTLKVTQLPFLKGQKTHESKGSNNIWYCNHISKIFWRGLDRVIQRGSGAQVRWILFEMQRLNG